MRSVKMLAALALTVGLSSSALAQRASTAGTVDPALIRFEPISTANVAAPIAEPQTFNTSFSLTNFLPRISMSAMSGKPVIGRSYFPSKDGMPGKSYLKAFGFGRPQPIQ